MGRYRFILIWLVLLPFPGTAADSPDSLFVKGNRLYEAGTFQEAVHYYQQLVDTGYQDPALFYNLGNTHFRLNNLADAILYYEKAAKLNPADADVQANLRLANLRITDRIEPIPAFFIQSWWHRLLLSGSLSAWSAAGVLCWLAGFACLVIYLFAYRPAVKRAFFYSGLAVLSVAMLLLMIAYSQHRYLDSRHEAIIFRGKVPVKSAPSTGEKTLFVIHEGTKVRVAERANGWWRVTLPNGHEGWIEAAAAREI